MFKNVRIALRFRLRASAFIIGGEIAGHITTEFFDVAPSIGFRSHTSANCQPGEVVLPCAGIRT